jgi:hypothetical protein
MLININFKGDWKQSTSKMASLTIWVGILSFENQAFAIKFSRDKYNNFLI